MVEAESRAEYERELAEVETRCIELSGMAVESFERHWAEFQF